ncbi:hypothetical protein EMCRGX_G020783 [Ephydatia muelleri]
MISFITLVHAATQCTFSTTPGVTSTVYNFSCTSACNYWIFYILDYPVRMTGCRSTLPCKVDTVSVSDLAKVARSELGYNSNSNSAISINATQGNLKMVVQCVITNTYVDGMMVRVVDTPLSIPTLSLSSSTAAGYSTSTISFTSTSSVTIESSATIQSASATPQPEVVLVPNINPYIV